MMTLTLSRARRVAFQFLKRATIVFAAVATLSSPVASARSVLNENGSTCLLDANGNMVGCQNPNRPRNDDLFFQELPNTKPARECLESYEKLDDINATLADTPATAANADRIAELDEQRRELTTMTRRFCD